VLKELKNRIADSIASHVNAGSAKNARLDELSALADFANKERVLKQGKDAGLAPREYEIFKLFVENPGIKYREVADRLGISVGAVSKTKARIAQALKRAG
jgi:DNA-binding CsgD family transcriptional regulator